MNTRTQAKLFKCLSHEEGQTIKYQIRIDCHNPIFLRSFSPVRHQHLPHSLNISSREFRLINSFFKADYPYFSSPPSSELSLGNYMLEGRRLTSATKPANQHYLHMYTFVCMCLILGEKTI